MRKSVQRVFIKFSVELFILEKSYICWISGELHDPRVWSLYTLPTPTPRAHFAAIISERFPKEQKLHAESHTPPICTAPVLSVQTQGNKNSLILFTRRKLMQISWSSLRCMLYYNVAQSTAGIEHYRVSILEETQSSSWVWDSHYRRDAVILVPIPGIEPKNRKWCGCGVERCNTSIRH